MIKDHGLATAETNIRSEVRLVSILKDSGVLRSPSRDANVTGCPLPFGRLTDRFTSSQKFSPAHGRCKL